MRIVKFQVQGRENFFNFDNLWWRKFFSITFIFVFFCLRSEFFIDQFSDNVIGLEVKQTLREGN